MMHRPIAGQADENGRGCRAQHPILDNDDSGLDRINIPLPSQDASRPTP